MTLSATLRELGRLRWENPAWTAFMELRAGSGGALPAPTPVCWQRLNGISPYLVAAVVKAEDPAFFSHRGIAWAFIRDALLDALHGQHLRGSSTITQQLAKNLYLGPGRSYLRKLREAIVARALEQRLSKARILELYLNLVEWGPGIWGIAAAADTYCARPASELSPFEAVVLVSLLPAPTRALEGANRMRAVVSQARTLSQLYRAGILDEEETRHVAEQLGRLVSQLEANVALPRALALVQHETRSPAPGNRLRLTVRALLETGSGYEQDLLRKRRARAPRGARSASVPDPALGEARVR